MFYQKHLLSPHNPIFIDEFTFKVYQSATDFVQISSWFTSTEIQMNLFVL